MTKKIKKRPILFWLKSNRGTNVKAVYNIPIDWNKEEIKDKLEHWCNNYGAWTHGDNYIQYGYRAVKIPKRRELLKQWDKLCDKRDRLHDRWLVMQEMFNVKEL